MDTYFLVYRMYIFVSTGKCHNVFMDVYFFTVLYSVLISNKLIG